MRTPERWIAQELVRLSTVPTALRRRHARAPPRRPAPVRGVRRRHPDRPRRADARRAARGVDDRQLLAGRRLEGHVGARGGRRPPSTTPPARRAGRRRGCPGSARASGPTQQQQQQQTASARPDRPRAVLDRPPAGARRAHRAHARRRLPRRRAGAPGRPRRRAAVVGPPADDRQRRAARDPGLARRGAARADARPRAPDVGAELRHARARGRPHRARRVLGRDVGGDQHVPPRAAAAATCRRRCAPARTRSTRTCASAAGCSGA